jgi:hypothetical protein
VIATRAKRQRLFLVRLAPRGVDFERWSRWVGDIRDVSPESTRGTTWWLLSGLKAVMCVGTEVFDGSEEARARLEEYVQAAVEKTLQVRVQQDPHGHQRFTLEHEGRVVAVSARRFVHASECSEAAKATLRDLASSTVPTEVSHDLVVPRVRTASQSEAETPAVVGNGPV